jgi:hypothetical protein
MLKSLQGHYIPICYGEVNFNGSRALLLSDVGGYSLNGQNVREIDRDVLRKMLHEAIRSVNNYLIEPPEMKLEHFHVVDDHIVMLDWEGKGGIAEEDAELCCNEAVDHLMDMYNSHWEFRKVLINSA